MGDYDPAYYQLNKEWYAARQRRYRAKHRETVLAKAKVKRDANKERDNAYIRAYYRQDPKRKFAVHIKNRYGLTIEQYDGLKVAQGGGCAMCGKVGRLFIDHDHKTGRVRGLLCPGCNGALGHFEKVGWWDLAQTYLARPDPLAELTAALKEAKEKSAC